jgi:hypothetical protein
MLIEEVSQLLKPGYQSVETGYFRLPNGQMHVRVLTRMPNCNGEMVVWWFKYLDNADKYRMWHPKDHISFRPLPNGHIIEEKIGEELWKARIEFADPSQFFDTAKFQEANIEAAFCARGYTLEGKLHGIIIHMVRKTYYGSEMRSRFWLFDASEEAGAGLMRHCMEEMGNLADFLPNLYASKTGERKKT